jgi:hypothetical protein
MDSFVDESINIADPTYCAFLSRKGRISISHKTKKNVKSLRRPFFYFEHIMQLYNLEDVIQEKHNIQFFDIVKLLNILFQVGVLWDFSQTSFDKCF